MKMIWKNGLLATQIPIRAIKPASSTPRMQRPRREGVFFK